MRKLYYSIAALSMVALLFACSKKDEPVVAQDDSQVYLSIEAQLPDMTPETTPDTKGHVGQVVTIKWTDGDPVYVYDESGYLGTLTATLIPNSRNIARLDGHVDKPSGQNLYLVVSPSFNGAPEMEEGKIKVSLANQTTVKTFVAYSVVKFKSTGISSLFASFKFASAQAQIYVYNTSPSSAINTATMVNVNDVCVLNITAENGVEVTGEAVAGYVSRTFNSTSSPEGENMFYIAMAPSPISQSGRILKISSTTESFYDFGFYKGKFKDSFYLLTIAGLTQSQAPTAEFTVGAGQIVNFSQSNLYWDGNLNSHRFEVLPCDFRHYPNGQVDACVNGNYTMTPDNTVGSFFFSNTESVSRAQLAPTEIPQTETIFADNADFTVLGYSQGYWKTLSSDQWQYLLNTRTTTTPLPLPKSSRFAYAVVSGVKGFILFPDSFQWKEETMGTAPKTVNKAIGSQAGWGLVTYTITQFEAMEVGGAVFIPTTGRRLNTGATDINPEDGRPFGYGYYWQHIPQYFFFMGKEIDYTRTKDLNSAFSLRLVHFK